MSDLPALAHPTGQYFDSAPVDTLPVDTPSVFAELIGADPQLLRAEFEALMAANYPPSNARSRLRPPRPNQPSRIDRARPGPPAISSSRPGFLQGPAGRTDRTDAERPIRERSPPS